MCYGNILAGDIEYCKKALEEEKLENKKSFKELLYNAYTSIKVFCKTIR